MCLPNLLRLCLHYSCVQPFLDRIGVLILSVRVIPFFSVVILAYGGEELSSSIADGTEFQEGVVEKWRDAISPRRAPYYFDRSHCGTAFRRTANALSELECVHLQKLVSILLLPDYFGSAGMVW